MQGTLTISNKKELTSGTTKIALGEGPYFSVTVDIFAIAFGVAPIPCPINPLMITAASYDFPKTLKQTNIPYKIINTTWHTTINKIKGSKEESLNKSIFIREMVKNNPSDISPMKFVILKSIFANLNLSLKFLKITATNIQVTTTGKTNPLNLNAILLIISPTLMQIRIISSCSIKCNGFNPMDLSIKFG